MSNQSVTDLIAKFHEGSCSREELMLLMELLEAGGHHRAILADVRQSFEQSAHAHAVSDFQRDQIKQRLQESIHTGAPVGKAMRMGLFRKWMGYAATILLLIVSGLWIFTHQFSKTEITWQEYMTQAGQKKKIVLPDSSIIFLNGNSTLRVPSTFLQRDRVIALTGEGFFSIQPKANQPFYVIGRSFTTRVLGTAFNIDTELDKSVAVKEGKVQVIHLEKHAALAADDLTSCWQAHVDVGKPLVTLGAHEQARFNEKAGVWDKEVISKFNDWTEGKLFLFNKPLSFMAAYLSRYYGERISIDPALDQATFSITINNKPIAVVMKTLAAISHGTLEQRRGGWYLKQH